MFKFWLGRLFIGTESSNHLEQNFNKISLHACLSSKIDHTLLLLNQMRSSSSFRFLLMNLTVIVAFEFRCSEDFHVQFSQLVFFIASTFHFPTQWRYILFKDWTKNHLHTPSVCPDDAMKIHIKTMFAQQKSMPFYYLLKLVNVWRRRL